MALAFIRKVQKGTKSVYEIFSRDDKMPKCCSKWTNKLNTNVHWKIVFLKIHKIKDIGLKWFQIRIVHRILATNITLKAMGISDTENCSLCNEERDSIEHCLWQCKLIKPFWTSLEKILNDKCENVSSVKVCHFHRRNC